MNAGLADQLAFPSHRCASPNKRSLPLLVTADYPALGL